MTSDNRFKPPEAALDLPAANWPAARGLLGLILLMAIVQVVWLVTHVSRILTLVGDGIVNPVGPFLCVLGSVCLCGAIVRESRPARRGRNLYLAAWVLTMVGMFLLGRPVWFAFWGFGLTLVAGGIGFAFPWLQDRLPRGDA